MEYGRFGSDIVARMDKGEEILATMSLPNLPYSICPMCIRDRAGTWAP